MSYLRHADDEYSDNAETPEIIRKIIDVYWLPLSRSANITKIGDTLVDSKLTEILNSVGAYLSSLDSKVARETKQFEEYVFLALLASGGDKYDPIASNTKLDVAAEKQALVDIFRQFGLSEANYRKRLDSHSSIVATAIEKRDGDVGAPMLIEDYSALRDSMRIDQLIREWTAAQNRTKEIYLPKSMFVEIMNGLFINKSLRIDERNRPIISKTDGKPLLLESLSSGEKQLLILLGEALRQEGRASTYIADEPELSLHVDWQSKLVENMMLLNANMQIIFATHSPDIVSRFSKNVIPMNKVF